MPPMPQLYFASPRVLPRAEKLAGRVVVLDIAFAATVRFLGRELETP